VPRTAKVLHRLRRHRWRGQVRELKARASVPPGSPRSRDATPVEDRPLPPAIDEEAAEGRRGPVEAGHAWFILPGRDYAAPLQLETAEFD
jgi:hypothetical protein